MPEGRKLPAERFAGLSGLALEQAWFQAGLMCGALGAAFDTVAQRPRHRDDALFWQFPCRTEGAAWDLHAGLQEPHRIGDELHLYLGLPWATWIDKTRKQAWSGGAADAVEQQWRLLGVRLSGLRQVLPTLGLGLRVHTVCQHIYWADLLPRWRQLGVTDLWLSHCPDRAAQVAQTQGLRLHPWRLYAVNVEDPSRQAGLDIGRDPAQRRWLASFVGAHAPHYLSDIRLRLKALVAEPDVRVEVTDQWHFEDVVYRHQIQAQLDQAPQADASVQRYNQLLSDSVFSLCPAGAGANTLRLWESLAVGSIPVLLGPWPRLPEGGSLPTLDWDRALLRCRDEELPGLLPRLRAMPLAERRERQQRGLALFELVRSQRCF